MDATSLAPADAKDRDIFVDKLLASADGTFRVFSIYLGERLGYFRALAGGAALTSDELARATRTDERYAREWLEQQTVCGVLRVASPSADGRARRYALPPGHEEALLHEASLNYIFPLVHQLVAVTRPLDRLLAAYRNGGGISFGEYGLDMRDGQAAMNRPIFMQLLTQEWLPAMPHVVAALSKEGSRAADLGCGAGWSSIALAKGYPSTRVDGIDLDAPSIELARVNAKAEEVADRVTFHARDAREVSFAGKYDLVTLFEALHDLSRPVDVLRTARGMLKPGGSVLVVDERVGSEFTPEGRDLEWMMYGWSVLHCLAAGKSESPSAETGTVLREPMLRRMAEEAGYTRVEVLPIEHPFFRLYELRP